MFYCKGAVTLAIDPLLCYLSVEIVLLSNSDLYIL